MRRFIILSYTENGGQLNKRLTDFFLEKGDVAVSYDLNGKVMSTNEILQQEWHRAGALVFVGALGIAVRHVAPFLESKVYDPAVLVLDEKGEFIIPVVSGHIGGGVALAKELAENTGGKPVITTATDVQECFAVDMFAVKNHLWIEQPERIRTISSALLQGGRVDVWAAFPIAGEVPEGLQVRCTNPDGLRVRCADSDGQRLLRADPDRLAYGGKAAPEERAAIMIGLPDETQQRISALYGASKVCVLQPRPYILGIGCKKGKTAEELYDFLQRICKDEKIDMHEIAVITSIDIKKEEPGLWELSRRLCVDFEVYDATALEQVGEPVKGSAFVQDTVGVDNVCERSAYCLAKKWTKRYRLRVGKQVQNGMTMALVEIVPEYRW